MESWDQPRPKAEPVARAAWRGVAGQLLVKAPGELWLAPAKQDSNSESPATPLAGDKVCETPGRSALRLMVLLFLIKVIGASIPSQMFT